MNKNNLNEQKNSSNEQKVKPILWNLLIGFKQKMTLLMDSANTKESVLLDSLNIFGFITHYSLGVDDIEGYYVYYSLLTRC